VIDVEAALVAAYRDAAAKHPERAGELTLDYVDRLRRLVGEHREISTRQYARENGYEERTIGKACRDGRLPARKHEGVWLIPCRAKLAPTGIAKAQRMRVVRSTQLARCRWSLELECGHEKTVTSPSRPRQAACPECSGQEQAR
jgi:hypothetical protein